MSVRVTLSNIKLFSNAHPLHCHANFNFQGKNKCQIKLNVSMFKTRIMVVLGCSEYIFLQMVPNRVNKVQKYHEVQQTNFNETFTESSVVPLCTFTF